MRKTCDNAFFLLVAIPCAATYTRTAKAAEANSAVHLFILVCKIHLGKQQGKQTDKKPKGCPVP
jgi:hypothetical protein